MLNGSRGQIQLKSFSIFDKEFFKKNGNFFTLSSFLYTNFHNEVIKNLMKTVIIMTLALSGLLSAPAYPRLSPAGEELGESSWNIFDDFSMSYAVSDKGIYGDDDRRQISELSDSEGELKELSRSVLAQVPRWRISSEEVDSYTLETKSLEKGMNFCPDEKFASLPLVSSCTGFLIGSDLMLTAGHCVKDKFECQKNIWILDYDNELGFSNENQFVKIDKNKVVTCEKLISVQENVKLDYALIKISKKLEDRKTFSIRKLGKVSSEATLAVIGHPMGLPKIVAGQARIRNNSLSYTFLTNADTFSGNSGSPVINMASLQVEGILVRGDSDFQMDVDLGCNRSYHCGSNDCKGETVMRTTGLPFKFFPRF
jgi:hypothetical protein